MNVMNTMAKNYLIKSTEDLLDIYSNALQHYITGRIGTKEAHIEDFVIEAASFAECFYSIVQALPKDN
jgi:5-formaminoimidazole-4-carboxamide-1-beta-D-ribofuranosyl 5'-monophosphate synthetase